MKKQRVLFLAPLLLLMTAAPALAENTLRWEILLRVAKQGEVCLLRAVAPKHFKFM
jgi:hypothetical protein